MVLQGGGGISMLVATTSISFHVSIVDETCKDWQMALIYIHKRWASSVNSGRVKSWRLYVGKGSSVRWCMMWNDVWCEMFSKVSSMLGS